MEGPQVITWVVSVIMRGRQEVVISRSTGRQKDFTTSCQGRQKVFIKSHQGRQSVITRSCKGHQMVVKGSHMQKKRESSFSSQQELHDVLYTSASCQ